MLASDHNAPTRFFTSALPISVSDGPEPGARVVLKVRRPRDVADRLRAEGFTGFVLVERMFMDEMRIYRNDDLPDESDYLSILFARR
jgi:precorrin-2/cobalt-factor-2 C20-methyltransferase